MVKIAQITDIHIDRVGENRHQIDTPNNFIRLLELADSFNCDYLVITGDLCFSAALPETYRWIREILKTKCKTPYYLLPGNHDNSSLLADSFELNDDLHGEELYYSIRLGQYPCIFLDTGAGFASTGQKSWLRKELRKADSPALVFMHHPPMLAGVPHMDNSYALEDRREFVEILSGAEVPVHVFCGHYHVDKLIVKANITIHITPSGYVQIDPRFEKFSIEHDQPGFRLIQCDGDTLTSEVHYIHNS